MTHGVVIVHDPDQLAAVAAGSRDEVTVVLDCDDDPAIALAALRTGWKHIAFTGTDRVRSKIAEIADAHGAKLHPPPTEAIDLAETDDIEAALSRA